MLIALWDLLPFVHLGALPLHLLQPWAYVDFVVYLRTKHASGAALSGVEATVWQALHSPNATSWLPVQQVSHCPSLPKQNMSPSPCDRRSV
jgi:hypothetical protein